MRGLGTLDVEEERGVGTVWRQGGEVYTLLIPLLWVCCVGVSGL